MKRKSRIRNPRSPNMAVTDPHAVTLRGKKWDTKEKVEKSSGKRVRVSEKGGGRQ